MRNLRPLNSTLSSREFSWSPQWQLVASPSRESSCCCCGGFRTKCNARCQNNCFTFPHFRLFCICYFLSVCLIVQTTKEREGEIERESEMWSGRERQTDLAQRGLWARSKLGDIIGRCFVCDRKTADPPSLPVPTASPSCSPNSILSLCASAWALILRLIIIRFGKQCKFFISLAS